MFYHTSIIVARFFGVKYFFELLKSDWSKPKKAALITVTATILVFGYCLDDICFYQKSYAANGEYV